MSMMIVMKIQMHATEDVHPEDPDEEFPNVHLNAFSFGGGEGRSR
jgi:hypothetical protein